MTNGQQLQPGAQPQDDKAFFRLRMVRVGNQPRMFVKKHGFGFFKADFVFSQVAGRFRFILFKSQRCCRRHDNYNVIFIKVENVHGIVSNRGRAGGLRQPHRTQKPQAHCAAMAVVIRRCPARCAVMAELVTQPLVQPVKAR